MTVRDRHTMRFPTKGWVIAIEAGKAHLGRLKAMGDFTAGSDLGKGFKFTMRQELPRSTTRGEYKKVSRWLRECERAVAKRIAKLAKAGRIVIFDPNKQTDPNKTHED